MSTRCIHQDRPYIIWSVKHEAFLKMTTMSADVTKPLARVREGLFVNYVLNHGAMADDHRVVPFLEFPFVLCNNACAVDGIGILYKGNPV